MKKIIIASIAVFALASCSGSRYGCHKPGRCVDVAKPEVPAKEGVAASIG